MVPVEQPQLYRFYTADVFTDQLFGGNQLAILPDARGLRVEQMQAIAREFNLSETVFVLPPDDPAHTCRLRIFTPATELPFAGHPTIGAAYVLAAIGDIALASLQTQVIFEEGVGPVPVTITAAQSQPAFAQLTAAQLPVFGPAPPPAEEIAALLALDAADVQTAPLQPQAVSCGVPFLVVPVRSRALLAQVHLNRAIWEQSFADFWAPHLYVIAQGEPDAPASQAAPAIPTAQAGLFSARMFAPAMGIAEDPATGAAATVLAAYLAQHADLRDGTLRWTISQGIELGRPSTLAIEAELRDGAIAAVRVGGSAVLVSEGTLRVAGALLPG